MPRGATSTKRRAARRQRGASTARTTATQLSPLEQIAKLAERVEPLARTMKCADCGHAMTSHQMPEGECSVDECSCGGFKKPAAADDVDAATVEAEEAAKETAAPAPTAQCASCDHTFAQHAPGGGACQMAGCDCAGFEESDGGGMAAEEADPPTDPGAASAITTSGTEVNQSSTRLMIVNGGGLTLMSPSELSGFLTQQISQGTLNFEFASTAEVPAPSATLPAPGAQADVPVVEQRENASVKRWRATLAPEGVVTDDGRMFSPGSITWRDLPLTLMGMIETQEGHDGAQVCGRIDRIYRAGDLIMGEGVFDNGEFGSEIARLVEAGTLRGVSVDIAIREYEVVSRAELEGDAPAEATEDDDGGLLDLLFGGEDVVFVVTDGVIGATTVCPFPAFAEAQIALTASSPAIWRLTSQAGFVVTAKEEACGCEPVETITAAAAGVAPLKPPAAWFENPELDGPTPLTVTDDGRVFGHVAAWGVCHTAFPTMCRTAPHTNTDYAYLHLKEVVCDDDSRVAVGTITIDGPHADQRLSRVAATAHYDDTGTAVADIRCGEDDHGIWFAGALRPDVSEVKVRTLRGATLSGDWRNVNGNLEMIAVLAVNVPGFPIPRPKALVASAGDQVMSLYAIGMVLGDEQRVAFTDLANRARQAA